jgi:hypothetical protein
MTNLLAIRNAHPRDANIRFQEEGHKYTILTDLNSQYTSVTTWNHSHFPHFDADAVIASMMKGKNWNSSNKYWGLTASQIKKQWADNGKEVAGLGTQMHYEIECFMGGQSPPQTPIDPNLLPLKLGGETPPQTPNDSSTPLDPNSLPLKLGGETPPQTPLDPNSLPLKLGGETPPQTPLDPNSLPLKYTHRDLLDYYKGQSPEGNEWGFKGGVSPPNFVSFLQDYPHLVPYRTEWLIYDDTVKMSGSIDMVYENLDDGTLSIYDWKRCKSIDKTNGWNKFAITECISHLPDSNFWHYALQLNTYKTILERNYGKRVSDMYLVRLHPDSTTYQLLKVPVLENEMNDLFELKRSFLSA